ncbi:MAG: VanW family protein [Oscillospiraceae bacterium]|nr:VanW family protein [Oscillospiraceae bacterium]
MPSKPLWARALLCLALLWAFIPWPGAQAVSPAAATQDSPYIAFASRDLKLYLKKSDKTVPLDRIPAGALLSVTAYEPGWLQVGWGEQTGYVPAKYTERLQPRDPLSGPLPHVPMEQALALVLKDASFQPEGFRGPVRVPAGSLLTLRRIQGDQAYFAYTRFRDMQALPLARLGLTPIVPWRQARPGDLISAFTSFYSTSRTRRLNIGRMANLVLSCQRLDGQVIEPGQAFSYNAVCGPYTRQNGYALAPIIAAGGADGYGGGTCQVSTTLYNNVLRLPMAVDEHHWHSQNGVSYVPAGFDATVGDKWDLVFRSLLPYAVRITAKAQGGLLTICVYRAE